MWLVPPAHQRGVVAFMVDHSTERDEVLDRSA